MPQTNDTFAATRIQPVLNPEEVCIVMRREPGTNALQFNVIFSSTPHNDPQVEADTQIVYATAVGLASIISDNSVVAWVRGCEIINAEYETRKYGSN